MYPTPVTICLIIGGIFLFAGMICDWLERICPAIVCAICAGLALCYPLYYAMTLPPI